jgi:DNA-binding SARP family transcriptional activator
VLAYVAVATDSTVNREALAGLLWAESAPENAKRTLAQTLYALRKECGAELIAGTSQLEVRTALLSVDALEFREAVRRDDFEQAIALYSGPFLDGVHFAGATEFEYWVEKMRSAFAAAHREALLQSARAHRIRGDEARALGRLEEAHAEYPDDASVLEELAAAYVANDAAHRARSAIDMFEHRLRNEYELPLPHSLVRVRSQLRTASSQSDVGDGRDSGAPALVVEPEAAAVEEPPLRHDREGPRSARYVHPWRWWRAVVVIAALCLVVPGGVWWYARHLTSKATSPYEARRLEQLALTGTRFAPLDSATIGRVAVLPPVNRTGSPAYDSVALKLQRHTLNAIGRSPASAVSSADIATYARTVGLGLHTPATPQQALALLERSGAALAIEPQLFRLGDSLRVHFTFFRHIARARRTVPGGVGVDQYEDGHLDGVEATVHPAAWEAEGPLRAFLQSLESCVRPARYTPPSAPWCWVKGRQLDLARARPSRLRTWWWELQTAMYLTRDPETHIDRTLRERALAHAARRQAIDSSHMGRIVVLPSRNISGIPALDSLRAPLDYQLHNVVNGSFAQGVPASYSTPMFSAQRNSRLPTTTDMQVAYVLRETRAGLAIQPLISRYHADSVRVHFVFYRNMLHTSLARAGKPWLETMSTPAVAGIARDGPTAIRLARRHISAFVRSLELCREAEHVAEDTAPWCWGEGQQLRLADGFPSQRGTTRSASGL